MKKFLVGFVAIFLAFVVLSKLAQNFQDDSFKGSGSDSSIITSTNTDGSKGGLSGIFDFSKYSSDNSYYTSPRDNDRTIPNTEGIGTSPFAGQIGLSLGNASYAFQTYEEYISIRNNGNPVNITGWTVTNGKGSRPIEYQYNSYVYPVADSGTIGEGTEFVSPDGKFNVGPIVLQKGDVAILQTGKPFSQFPFSLYTSFRENICMGYLDKYPLSPRLDFSCPLPSNDPEVRSVTDECYDYMRSLRRCEDPEKFTGQAKKDYDFMTSQCKAFMAERTNYQSCVDRNKNTPNFSTKQWRVFLNKDRELWAQNRETVTLYDAQGLIVSQSSY